MCGRSKNPSGSVAVALLCWSIDAFATPPVCLAHSSPAALGWIMAKEPKRGLE